MNNPVHGDGNLKSLYRVMFIGRHNFPLVVFISCVSGETMSLGTVTSRRHSVQAPGDVRVECWRFVIGRRMFKPSGETCSCVFPQPHIPHLPLW